MQAHAMPCQAASPCEIAIIQFEAASNLGPKCGTKQKAVSDQSSSTAHHVKVTNPNRTAGHASQHKGAVTRCLPVLTSCEAAIQLHHDAVDLPPLHPDSMTCRHVSLAATP
jgi:hypothetical protein